MADAYLYIITTWPAMIDMDISEHKNLAAYQARISERQSVKDLLAETS